MFKDIAEHTVRTPTNPKRSASNFQDEFYALIIATKFSPKRAGVSNLLSNVAQIQSPAKLINLKNNKQLIKQHCFIN